MPIFLSPSLITVTDHPSCGFVLEPRPPACEAGCPLYVVDCIGRMSRHGGLSPHCRPLIAAQSQRGLLSVPTGTEFHFHPEVRVPQQPSPSAAASRPATSATKESSVVPPGPLIRPPPGRWPVSTSTTPTLRIRTEVLQTHGRSRYLAAAGSSAEPGNILTIGRVRVPARKCVCRRKHHMRQNLRRRKRSRLPRHVASRLRVCGGLF